MKASIGLILALCCWYAADAKWCHRESRGCKGHQVKLIKGAKLADCLGACNAISNDCKAVSFHAVDGYCSLKNYICLNGEQGNRKAVKGSFYFRIADVESCSYQYCKKEGKGCPAKLSGKVVSYELALKDCRAKCNADPTCKAFSYHTGVKGKNCNIKSEVCKGAQLEDRTDTEGTYYIKSARLSEHCPDFLKRILG